MDRTSKIPHRQVRAAARTRPPADALVLLTVLMGVYVGFLLYLVWLAARWQT